MRIAISGTYSAGKTTLTEALTLTTGVPRTQARTVRELLPDAVPGKTLEQCNPYELINLGLTRLTERVVNEERAGERYFSDGSCLDEWVFGAASMKTGIDPAEPDWLFGIKKVHRGYIEAFGSLVKRHAKNTYTQFVHLPIEFPLVSDGHRPVSERFRTMSNDLLISTLEELRIPYVQIGGSMLDRIKAIVDHFSLPTVMDAEKAIDLAVEKVKAQAMEIEQHRKSVLASQKAQREAVS